MLKLKLTLNLGVALTLTLALTLYVGIDVGIAIDIGVHIEVDVQVDVGVDIDINTDVDIGQQQQTFLYAEYKVLPMRRGSSTSIGAASYIPPTGTFTVTLTSILMITLM